MEHNVTQAGSLSCEVGRIPDTALSKYSFLLLIVFNDCNKKLSFTEKHLIQHISFHCASASIYLEICLAFIKILLFELEKRKLE